MFTSVNFREDVGADSLTVGGPGTAVFPANKTEVGTCWAGLAGWLTYLLFLWLIWCDLEMSITVLTTGR